MRSRFICLVTLLLTSQIISNPLEAQTIVPVNSTLPAATTVLPKPAAYNSSATINYVRTWQPWKPITDETQVPLQPVAEVKQSTSYVDGLGRGIQTVSKGVTPLGKDMVSYKVFDAFGRETLQYLPYASTASDGYFKTNPSLEQQTYFTTPSLNNDQYNGEQVFYGQTVLETSPLGRSQKTMAAGNSWAGSGRGVTTEYRHNLTTDAVRVWTIGDAMGSIPLSNTIYGAGQLYKTVTKDEGGKAVVEFTDKEGKVVLKKVQLSDNPSFAHTGWLCTYYVYDDYGQLRYVVQPKAVENRNAANNWVLNSEELNEFCFRYEYDSRNRMIIKKFPGAVEVWMVYDARDRLVMTQDANLRAQTPKKWLYMTYDALDRPVSTGLLTSLDDRNAHQLAAGTSVSYPVLSGYTYEELTHTYYDGYAWGGAKSFEGSDVGKLNAGTNPFAEVVTQSPLTFGMVTGSKTKVLGTPSQYLVTTVYYDEIGRAIESVSDNVAGGVDVALSQYDFSGKVLSSYLKHQNPASATATMRVLTRMDYDGSGRLTKIWKRLNDAGAEKLVAISEYDEMGQLAKKKLGVKPAAPTLPLETLSYEYNIRGWLKSINKGYANNTSTEGYFGQILSYDHGFSSQAFNGNIAGIQWRSRGDGEQRAYGFSYDAVNRLAKADFTQYTGGGWNTDAGLDFSVGGSPLKGNKMSYDENGNILEMWQKGWKLTGSDWIDQLVYTYKNNNNNSNQLLRVIDNANEPQSKLGDFKYASKGSFDYSYDNNGNLTVDNNKDISSITYNHLNLPSLITVGTKGTIAYLYDAGGNKHQKITTETSASVTYNGIPHTTSITTITRYIGGFTYESKQYSDGTLNGTLGYTDKLLFFGQEEGRIRPGSDPQVPFVFDYMLKDHLGNVRMVLTEEVKADPYPVVTFEDATQQNEKAYYEGVNVAREVHDIYGNSPTNKVQSLRKNTQATGAGKLLKVMAGDRIHLIVDYYIPGGQTTDNSSADGIGSAVTSLLALLSGGAVPGHEGAAATITNSLNTPGEPFASFFQPQSSSVPNAAPKAYLNILFFDEQFRFVQQGSEALQVSTTGSVVTLSRNGALANEAPKNGYLYAYLSNESNNVVYFDNFQVQLHERGPILEETHYYPFGLTMAGISSKAAGGVVNRKKYNGKEEQREEFSDGSGIEWLDYGARMFDNQIGRWHAIDPLADKYLNFSSYAFSINNPLRFYDPNGLEVLEVNGGVRFTGTDAISAFRVITGETENVYINVMKDKKDRDGVNNPDKKGLYKNWSVFSVENVRLAATALSGFQNNSIKNLVLSNHGASQDDKSWFAIFDERRASSDRAISTDDIVNYNDKGGRNLEGNEKDVKYLKMMGAKVADNGNFIFTFCYTGKGDAGKKTAQELGDLFGNRFNVFLPIGYSREQTQKWTTGPSIYLGGTRGTSLTPDDPKDGWLQQNRKGITKIFDITISTNAESAVKIIATNPNQ
ncbi:MAG: hypothetical protein EOO06_05315 [Chitinophagaceae bacterium]|nr:MAG: hypothetical protein EOO06_05315 [Chitinophagaceae bacterium]